jgi:nicotinamide-nucleotide amidase
VAISARGHRPCAACKPSNIIYTASVNAEIIAIGSELLTPFRKDTNSLYVTEKLNQLGVAVKFKTVVGDDRADLVATAQHALFRSDIVLFMGGLGPTEDDLTREAVAEALGLELKRDPEVLRTIEERFASFGRKMTPNNAKQADVITGGVVLANRNGTAAGQWISGKYEGRERIVILLPGPPSELKPLFDEQCFERLRAKLPPAFIATRVLKVAMLGESAVDARVAPIYTRYPDIQTTILAGAGDIQFNLLKQSDSLEQAEARVEELAGLIEDELGDALYSSKGESIEQIVGYYLQMRNATLAVAESCTGGMVSARITSIAGSSRYFLGGAIVYSNELKTEFADVPASVIAKHGAVSSETAAAMAEGIREKTGATLGLSITGIAGPGGGTSEKPVGLVFLAVAGERGTEVVERKFPGDRHRVQTIATQQALDLVRRRLM